MAQQQKVAVIGAGAAGLVTARELQREGHQITVFEKSDQIGGTWVYTPRVESDPLGINPKREIVHSSIYSSLRTNLPRHLMGFSDYPFTVTLDGELRDFPGHGEVLEFLNNFARDCGLTGLIRFNTEVIRVEKVDDLWVVESRLGGGSGSGSEELFDAVVVCNGHYTKPRLADIPGIKLWPGKQVHSHNYRVPDPYHGKVVVVIGAGPSAHDICQEVSQVAKEVHISSRSPDIKVAKLDMFTNVWQHSGIECCHENGEVAFQDGASIAADIILHCTGYKYDLPFLKTNGILTIHDNRIEPLYKHVFPPEYAPGLSFIGLSYRVVVFFMLEVQARWVAYVLSGKVVLPSKEEMLADVQEHYRKMEEEGVPEHHTHRLPLNSFEYLDPIAAQTGLPSDEQRKVICYKLFNSLKGLSWYGSIKDVDMGSLLE